MPSSTTGKDEYEAPVFIVGATGSLQDTDSDEISGARLGQLRVRDRKVIETPNYFAVTSRGVVPHITPDAISEYAEFGGVHMALEDCKCSATMTIRLLTELKISKEPQKVVHHQY